MATRENISLPNISETNTRILQFLQTAQYAEAEKLCAWSIDRSAEAMFEPHFYLGVALQFQGKVQHALEVFKLAQALSTQNIDVMQAIASCLDQLQRYDEAYHQLMLALAIAPQDGHLNANIGAILEKLKKPEEALAYYDIALKLNPKNLTALLNRGSLLATLGRKTEGLLHCQAAYQIHPHVIGTLYNLADALLGLFRYEEALHYCNNGLAMQPKHANLLFKKGLALSCLRRFDEARSCLAEAQVLDPKVLENALPFIAKMGSHVDVSLSPQTLYLDAMYQAQAQCFWQYRADYIAEWKEAIFHPDTATQTVANLEFGFQVISIALEGEARLKLSKNMAAWVQDMVWLEGVPPFSHLPKQSKKIRIGYFSSDFRIHPVGLLSRQIYALHDQSLFEIYVYSSFNAEIKDDVRQSVEESCTVFRDVSLLNDRQVAELMHQDQIEILVDLNGYTTRARSKVMAMRPAPIQLAYLGYPGTSGADYIDYAIVDSVIAHQPAHWSESLIMMPHAFSPYDNETSNTETLKTRKDYQLPEDGIVFCCFNNNYKIEPEIFSCWMRILKAVPNAVLWLVASSSEIQFRLKEAAQAQQVDSERLIFAPFVVHEEHLVRYQLADLFLDTYWHNAHTTAADALWQGLPVITCAGDVISSRLAASLLYALEMPELVTESFDAYEALAIYYATHHQERLLMRERLKNKRRTAPLFDSAMTTLNLEQAYKMMWQRYCDGLPPANMQVVENNSVASLA